MLAGKCGDFAGFESNSAPRIVLAGDPLETVELHAGHAAAAENSARFRQVIEDDFAARDVLEDGIRVHEVEGLILESLQIRPAGRMRVGVCDAGEIPLSESNHPLGYVHTMNFTEVRAQGQHQPAGSATDLEGTAFALSGRGRDPAEFLFQTAD